MLLLGDLVGFPTMTSESNLDLIARAVRAGRHPLIAAGGITTLDDLRALEALGVASAVIGMALYTGDMDAAACAAEFGGRDRRST